MPTIQPSRRWEWCGTMAHGDWSFTLAWRKWKRSLSETSFLYNRVMEPPTCIVDDTVDGKMPAPPGIYIYVNLVNTGINYQPQLVTRISEPSTVVVC